MDIPPPPALGSAPTRALGCSEVIIFCVAFKISTCREAQCLQPAHPRSWSRRRCDAACQGTVETGGFGTWARREGGDNPKNQAMNLGPEQDGPNSGSEINSSGSY